MRRSCHSSLVDSNFDNKTYPTPPSRRASRSAASRCSTSTEWLQWLLTRLPSIEPKTQDSYQWAIHQHLIPGLGHVRLVQLSVHHVQEFLNEKLASGLAPKSVANLRAGLRAALNDRMDWELVGRNVAARTRLPKREKAQRVVLTVEQAWSLLDAVKGDRLEALYWLALTTGLREGELLGLRWCDIDWDNKILCVVQEVQRAAGELRVKDRLKTKRAARLVAVPERALTVLREHRRRQVETGEASDLIFPSSAGTPKEPRQLLRHFKRVLRRSGLPEMRFYDLRHMAASLLVALGVHPRVVMEVLGHTTITMSMDTYSHVLPQLLREAAEKMDGLFQGRP